MTLDLFHDARADAPAIELIAEGAVLLHARACDEALTVLAAVDLIVAQAPLRQMCTPSGKQMSVAMTNCGELGWVTDRRGYRYEAHDPHTGRPWPAMPTLLANLASAAAALAGFASFRPDACLINEYRPGARMTLHQDRDEHDFSQPIVSASFGLPATFLFGGDERSKPARRLVLRHGDIVVWGGPSRLRFHGVLPLKQGVHDVLGERRMNLTFRKAG